MSCILSIDTSTEVCSVALSEDGMCIFHKEDFDGHRHAENIGPFVDKAMSFADSHAIPLDAVAVSSGPGSYTGLRIGVSMAKGICYALDLKLIAVPTLQLLSVPVLLQMELEDDALLCPMIDARRMEVYAAVYDRGLRELRPIQADVVDAETYKPWLDSHPMYFFGNGACKCKDILTHPNAHFLEGKKPLAKYMFPLAEKRIALRQYEDVAYFTPFYLKDYVAKKAKNKVLEDVTSKQIDKASPLTTNKTHKLINS